MDRSRTQQALLAFVMCNPLVIAPLCSIKVLDGGDVPLRVEGRKVTLGEGASQSLERTGHILAEGIVHVMLGHPGLLAAKHDRKGFHASAFDIACRLRAHQVIADTRNMPRGMFEPDPAMRGLHRALADNGVAIARDQTFDDLHDSIREALAMPGVADAAKTIQPVILRAVLPRADRKAATGTVDPEVAALTALAAEHADKTGWDDVTIAARRMLGNPPAAGHAVHAAELAKMFDVMESVESVDDAKAAIRLAETADIPLHPVLVSTAVMEATLRTLKRRGLKPSELFAAFHPSAKRALGALSDQPVVPLDAPGAPLRNGTPDRAAPLAPGARDELRSWAGAGRPILTDGEGTVLAVVDADGVVRIAMPHAIAKRLADMSVVAMEDRVEGDTLGDWTARIAASGRTVRHLE